MITQSAGLSESETYPASVVVDAEPNPQPGKRIGTSTYPSLNCTYQLIFIEIVGDSLRLRERKVSGRLCLVDDYVALKLQSSRTLYFQSYRSGQQFGGAELSSGTLYK